MADNGIASESVSHTDLSDSLQTHGLYPVKFLCPWDSPGKHAGVDCHSLLLGIVPIERLNLGLLHSRQILCNLSHQGIYSGIHVGNKLAVHLGQWWRATSPRVLAKV